MHARTNSSRPHRERGGGEQAHNAYANKTGLGHAVTGVGHAVTGVGHAGDVNVIGGGVDAGDRV